MLSTSHYITSSKIFYQTFMCFEYTPRCMNVCVNICMYVCMYVLCICMYTYTYIYGIYICGIYIYLFISYVLVPQPIATSFILQPIATSFILQPIATSFILQPIATPFIPQRNVHYNPTTVTLMSFLRLRQCFETVNFKSVH